MQQLSDFLKRWRLAKRSLVNKLLVAFLILVVVPTVLAFGLSSLVLFKRLDDEVSHRFHEASKTIFAEIHERERQALVTAEMVYAEVPLDQFFAGDVDDNSALADQLRNIQSLTGVDFIELATANRVLITNRYGLAEVVTKGFSGVAKEAISERQSVEGIELVGDALRMVAGIPVGGEETTVILVGYFLDEAISEELRNLSGMDVTFFLGNKLLYSTARNKSRNIIPFFVSPEIDEAMNEFRLLTTRETIEGKVYELVFHPLIDYRGQLVGSIATSTPIDYLLEVNRRTLLFLGGLTALLVIISLLFGYFVAHFILRPLRDLQQASQRIATGDLSHGVPIQTSDEIGDLAESFNQMISALRHTFHDLEEANIKTRQAHLDTILRLAYVAEYRDVSTAIHIRRISDYSASIAEAMRLSREEIDLIRYASPMHDIGKIGIPDSILLKDGKLTHIEYDEMKKHTVFGSKIFSGSSSPLLQAAEVISLTHHERYDGKGYPYGLKGDEIPVFGRIVAVVDVFDALTSERCYKPAFSIERSLQIIKEESGKQFDPKVVDAFFSIIDKIMQIKEESVERYKRFDIEESR